MIWLAVPLGLAIGLSLGALGGGGSILTVPALVYLLGQDTRTATTSSLLIVGVTSLAGMLAHARAGRVRVQQGVVFGVLGIAGTWVGSRLSTSVPPQVLLAAFSVLMLVVAALMLARVRRATARERAAQPVSVGASVPDGRPERTADRHVDDTGTEPLIAFRPTFTCACPRVLRVLVTATAVGLLTGFFGVGGGFAVVPALVLSLGFSMPVAVGTSLLVISLNSASALLARAGAGVHLDWALIGVFTLAAVAGGLVGGRLATRVRPATLTRAFAALLLLVSAYTAARSVPQLF